MPNQGGIQLLPETRRKIEVRTPGENRWLYAGIAFLVLVFAVTGGLSFYGGGLESRFTDLDSDIANLENQRDKKVEEKLLTLNKQMSSISRLLDDHISWSKALSRIEALTQPQVQFITFSGLADGGRFDMRAQTPNYTILARQIAAFVSDELIKSIDLNEVRVLTSGQLEFGLTIKFDENKFIKQ